MSIVLAIVLGLATVFGVTAAVVGPTLKEDPQLVKEVFTAHPFEEVVQPYIDQYGPDADIHYTYFPSDNGGEMLITYQWSGHAVMFIQQTVGFEKSYRVYHSF